MFGSLPTRVLVIVVVLYPREAMMQTGFKEKISEVQVIRADQSCNGGKCSFSDGDCADKTENYIRIRNVNIIGESDEDTSFLFCGDKYPPPYVSIHEATNVTVKYDHKVNMTFKIEDVPKVKCTEHTFRCSDFECIYKELVCDGTKNCTNGQDEYCVKDFTKFTTPSLPVCFLCDNGQCIQPILSVYDEYDTKNGKKRDELWWLCDGYNHCKDGTDESTGACGNFSTANDPFFSCVPRLLSTNNASVNILQTKLCDGTDGCLHGEDESTCEDDKATNSSKEVSVDKDGSNNTDTQTNTHTHTHTHPDATTTDTHMNTHTDTPTGGMAGWAIFLIVAVVVVVLFGIGSAVGYVCHRGIPGWFRQCPGPCSFPRCPGVDSFPRCPCLNLYRPLTNNADKLIQYGVNNILPFGERESSF